MRRLLVGDELQPLVDRRELDVELARAAAAAWPSAPGTARAACCSATRLSSAAMRVWSTRICGLAAL